MTNQHVPIPLPLTRHVHVMLHPLLMGETTVIHTTRAVSTSMCKPTTQAKEARGVPRAPALRPADKSSLGSERMVPANPRGEEERNARMGRPSCPQFSHGFPGFVESLIFQLCRDFVT